MNKTLLPIAVVLAAILSQTLRQDLIRSLKMLAVVNDVRANDLLEEAIQDLLEKYEKKAKK